MRTFKTFLVVVLVLACSSMLASQDYEKLSKYISQATGDYVGSAACGWTDYHPDETTKYDCGPCHMTNYKETGRQ